MLLKRFSNLLGGVVRLVRPVNCLMFFAGSFVGGMIVDRFRAFEWPENKSLLLASMSTLLVGAGANAINDVFDVTADSVNRPDRPIPAGDVSTPIARAVWLVLSALGIGAGFVVTSTHGAVAVVMVGVMYLYSAKLKSVPVIGNLVVGAAVSIAVAYGGLAAGSLRPVLPAVGFAFLTSLAREVIKDVEDVPGDSLQKVVSLPLRHGEKTSRVLFSILIGLTLALTPVPYVALGYGGLYLLLILIADGVLLAAWWSGMHEAGESATRSSALVKVAMVLGLGALSVSGVVG